MITTELGITGGAGYGCREVVGGMISQRSFQNFRFCVQRARCRHDLLEKGGSPTRTFRTYFCRYLANSLRCKYIKYLNLYIQELPARLRTYVDQLGVVLRLDSSLNRDYTGWFSVLRAVSVKCAFPAPHIPYRYTPASSRARQHCTACISLSLGHVRHGNSDHEVTQARHRLIFTISLRGISIFEHFIL